jgi:hypothetical protein
MIDVPRLFTNLRPLPTSRMNGFERDADSVTLDAGANASDFRQGVRVYGHARRGWAEGIRFQLTQERRPDATGADGSWFNFGLCLPLAPLIRYRGDTGDRAFARKVRWGWRITMANFNSVEPGLNDALRLRTWPTRAAVPQIQPAVPVPFAVGVPSEVLIDWDEGNVSCAVRCEGEWRQQRWKVAAPGGPSGPVTVFYASPGTRYRVQAVEP